MENHKTIVDQMTAIIARADAEKRDMTAEEITAFDKLNEKLNEQKSANCNAERRSQLAAVRQTASAIELGERFALRADQSLASLPQFQRAPGDMRRVGDMVRAALGMEASQNSYTGSAGGFTVPGAVSAEIIDRARSKSRVIQAGARTIPIGTSDTRFVTIENDPTIRQHAQNETTEESEIVFGSRVFVPRTKIVIVRASVELVEDAPNFNNTVDDVLGAGFATEMDRSALYGTGVGEQLGVLNDEGIPSVSGAGLATWGPFARALQSVRSSNYIPGAFILSPGGVGALDDLVEGSDSNQPLRRPPSLENAPFLDTTSIPDGATTEAIVGQWDQLFIALRTPITIEATRVGGDSFNRLSVLIRAYMRVDSFAVRKTAFTRITGIPVPAIA